MLYNGKWATNLCTGQLEISTSIKTAIPLSKNIFQECHPEEVQGKIADKLFDYLLK